MIIELFIGFVLGFFAEGWLIRLFGGVITYHGTIEKEELDNTI